MLPVSAHYLFPNLGNMASILVLKRGLFTTVPWTLSETFDELVNEMQIWQLCGVIELISFTISLAKDIRRPK